MLIPYSSDSSEGKSRKMDFDNLFCTFNHVARWISIAKQSPPKISEADLSPSCCGTNPMIAKYRSTTLKLIRRCGYFSNVGSWPIIWNCCSMPVIPTKNNILFEKVSV